MFLCHFKPIVYSLLCDKVLKEQVFSDNISDSSDAINDIQNLLWETLATVSVVLGNTAALHAAD